MEKKRKASRSRQKYLNAVTPTTRVNLTPNSQHRGADIKMQIALKLATIKPTFDQVNLRNVAIEKDSVNSSRNQHNSLSSQGSQPGKDFKTYAQVRRESKQRQIQGSSSPREAVLIVEGEVASPSM
jgi:hypothetical protein